MVGFWPMGGPPLPTLSEPFTSVTVLAPTIGSAGLTDAPWGGASAASGSYSAALFGLNGNADATSCAPAAFSAARSPAPDASGFAGPLTVARLFRTVLLFLGVFDDRDDLAMGLWATWIRDSVRLHQRWYGRVDVQCCGHHGWSSISRTKMPAVTHLPRFETGVHSLDLTASARNLSTRLGDRGRPAFKCLRSMVRDRGPSPRPDPPDAAPAPAAVRRRPGPRRSRNPVACTQGVWRLGVERAA